MTDEAEKARAKREKFVFHCGEAFVSTYEALEKETMAGPSRSYGLWRAIQYVVKSGIQGAFVEAGVWRGGQSMIAAKAFMHFGAKPDLHLFDTFAGMTEPTEFDTSLKYTADRTKEVWAASQKGDFNRWCGVDVDFVKKNMETTGYPTDRIHYHVGPVEQTPEGAVPERISVLRLDTDFYESTKWEMEHMYPKLAPGGVLLLDDYGHWEGCRKAVDDYLAATNEPILLSRLDDLGYIGVKQGL